MRKDLDAELPSHVEQTVQTIAALHGQHQRRTSRAQRFVQATTRIVGSPIFAGTFTVLLTIWVVTNVYQLFVGQIRPSSIRLAPDHNKRPRVLRDGSHPNHPAT